MSHPTRPPAEEPRSALARLRRAVAGRFPWTGRLYRRILARVLVWVAIWRDWRQRPGPDGPGRLRTVRWLAAIAGQIRRRRREPRLTVAVDASPFWEPLTGIGWYLHLLLRHLADSPDVCIRLYGPTVVASPDLEPPVAELPSGPALERVLYPVPDGLLLPAGLLIRWLRRAERLLIALDGNAVLFAPNFFLPPRFDRARGALVATVHDLGLRRVPWTLRARTRRELATRLEETMARAARVITVSGAVRDELVEYGYAARERVRVVHHGAGQLEGLEPEQPPAGLPDRYGLHVGTLEPRKNIGCLLDSWRRLDELMEERPVLLLCGRYGWRTDEIRRQVGAAEAEGWARHLGYVTPGQLAALYRHAEVVVFPTLYEGFGLPAIEALAAGTPLVCSDIPALREVAGDAARYAPVGRPDLFAEELRRALTDPDERRRLREGGRRRAAGFRWPEAARRTVAVWREAAAR